MAELIAAARAGQESALRPLLRTIVEDYQVPQ
jgi:hypothetical protein